MISRRTIVLMAVCGLAIAIPTFYSKGRAFEGRRLEAKGYVQAGDVLDSFPIVFVRTLVGGEPEILRVIAGAGLLLAGICVISLAFDFAPKRVTSPQKAGVETEQAQPMDELPMQDSAETEMHIEAVSDTGSDVKVGE